MPSASFSRMTTAASTSRSSRARDQDRHAASPQGLGRRPGEDRRHGRRGRRGRRLQGGADARARARPDRALPRVRPARTRQRHALHARPGQRPHALRRPAHPPPRLHAGPRRRARLDPADRGARAEGGLGRPREPRDRRLQGAARARRRHDATDVAATREFTKGIPPARPSRPHAAVHRGARGAARVDPAVRPQGAAPARAAVGGRRVVPQRGLPQDGRRSASSA